MEENFTFEKSLQMLEEIIERLESGETSLEEAIELYKKGASLCSECSKTLEDAKLTIRSLSKIEDNENA